MQDSIDCIINQLLELEDPGELIDRPLASDPAFSKELEVSSKTTAIVDKLRVLSDEVHELSLAVSKFPHSDAVESARTALSVAFSSLTKALQSILNV